MTFKRKERKEYAFLDQTVNDCLVPAPGMMNDYSLSAEPIWAILNNRDRDYNILFWEDALEMPAEKNVRAIN